MTTHTQGFPLAAAAVTGGTPARSRTLTVATWIITAGVAAMFLMAGFAKLSGAPPMVQMYEAIGVGQWFRYVTGAIEVGSALALLVPSVALYAALALAATMVGAIVTHLAIIGGSPVVPAILLASASFIAWSRGSRR